MSPNPTPVAFLARLPGYIRTTRVGAALVAALTVLVFSLVPAYVALNHSREQARYMHGEAERHLATRMAQARALLDRAKTVPGIVAMTLSQVDSDDRYESAVRHILAMSGVVESVTVTSLQRHASVVHRALADQLEPAARPLRPQGVLVADKKAFIGIGMGTLMIREPLSDVGSGGRRFWGYVTAEASLADLIQELSLLSLVNDGFGVHLRVQWQSGTAETVIYSGGNAEGAGVTQAVPLAGNAMLALTVRPPQPVLTALHYLAFAALAIMAVLLFALTYHLLRRPHHLQREVDLRTQQIAAEKAALRKEIDARIQAEGHLERSHALLDSIFEHLPGMIVLKRVSDRRVARINSSAETLLGRSRDYLCGRSDDEIYGAGMAEVLRRSDDQALDGEALVVMPVQRVEMPAVSPRWIQFSKTVLRDRDGQPQYILEFGEDMTERENLELRLRDQLRFLEQLIEAFPGPVFSTDVEGRYTAVNAPFEVFVGKPRAALLGRTVFDLVPAHIAREASDADRELLATGGKRIYESHIRLAGADAEVMFHKAVFHGADGRPAGIVGFALDISARKSAERRVANLNRVLTLLSAINRLIIHTRDRTVLLTEARRIMQEQGGFPAVWIRTRDGDASAVIADPDIRHYAERICGEIENPERNCWPERRLHCQAMDCCSSDLAAELANMGLQSLVHLPLLGTDGESWGDIGILGAVGQSFSDEERDLLEELAGNLSFALGALQQDEARRAAENKFQLAARVFESNSEGIIITDDANRIVMVNQAFTTVTGYTADEVIGKTPTILNSGTHPPEFFRQMWHVVREHGQWRGEIINRRKNGENFPEWLTLSEVRNDEGRVTHYVGVFSDLTAHRTFEARLDFLAHYDALTSLPNRTHFGTRLEKVIDEARTAGKRVAVIYFDLDRFKLINETIGHVAADQLLVELSTRLLGEARSKLDVARLGGDHFAVIMSVDTVAQATVAVKRIQDKLARPFLHFLDQEIHISTSIGVSLFPEDGADVGTLTRNADSAMYKAIEEGGNTYRFFQQHMNERAAERVQLESRLHHALEREELSVHFQPFVAAGDGRVVGAEALLRWNCPELGGQVSPGVFIPLLEEIGLVRQVGAWVLDRACAEVARWPATPGEAPFVAVNISALQLTDDLPTLVQDAVTRHGIRPEQLEIELTESAIMRDADHGIGILHALKALGVQLSIDDFGTGYSSLSYLKRLPMTTLKIDRSFVIDIPRNTEAVSIARAILALGHSLHLNIIAEGVETQEQVEFLRGAGCDLLQGYYFAKAMPAGDFARRLREAPVFALPTPAARPLQLLSGSRSA